MKVAEVSIKLLLGLLFGILVSLSFSGLKRSKSGGSSVPNYGAMNVTFITDELFRDAFSSRDADVRGNRRTSRLETDATKMNVTSDFTSSIKEESISTQVHYPLDSTFSRGSTKQTTSLASTTAVPPRTCQYDFKVYVYELPPDIPVVRLGNEARANYTLHVCRKCMLEQFGLEYIVNDFFTQFCGRTYDPSEANYFYLPLLRDAEFRVTVDSASTRKRQPSPAEEALLDIIEKGQSKKWMEIFNITELFLSQAPETFSH